MSASDAIKATLKRKHITQVDLAVRLGISKQNLNNKLKRDHFTNEELSQIADALGCTVQILFLDKDTGE